MNRKSHQPSPFAPLFLYESEIKLKDSCFVPNIQEIPLHYHYIMKERKK